MSCGKTEIVRAGGDRLVVVPDPAQPIAVVSGGQRGPPGADGVAEAFEHVQNSASIEWTVNHNLGVRPVVTVLSAGGAEMEANVLHLSNNVVKIYFASAQTGRVRCI